MIKIDIVSGFLGAGKTTFIKKLLKDYSGEDIVIIENEFGDIGIDGEILQREGYRMFEISTGCICCLMQRDFMETLTNIINDLSPDRVIIEPTGISILSDILKMLRKDFFVKTCRINSLITIIDCENYLAQEDIFGEFFEDQIANATRLLFSKINGARKEEIEEIFMSVRCKNATAPVVIKDWDELGANELAGYINADLVWDYSQPLAEPAKRSCREGKFSTFARQIDFVMTKERLANILTDAHSSDCGTMLRGKGFVNCREGAYEFSCSGKKFELYPLSEPVSGKICFIGLNLNKNRLSELWRAGEESL